MKKKIFEINIINMQNNICELCDRIEKTEEALINKIERIDKAIKYINSFDYYIPEENKEELKYILEGKEVVKGIDLYEM